MKVTQAQAQANRALVVETASALFRERGYDGIGVADLMAAAGFTHGGFYRQFGSKTALMAESAACGIAQTAAFTARQDPLTFVERYVSRAHRDARASGCTMAALGGDAARQPDAVRATFADGIERLLAAMQDARSAQEEGPGEGAGETEADAAQARARDLDTLAHVVGAVVMSRACPDDSALADEILSTCRQRILASLRPEALAHDSPADGT